MVSVSNIECSEEKFTEFEFIANRPHAYYYVRNSLQNVETPLIVYVQVIGTTSLSWAICLLHCFYSAKMSL